MPVLWCAKERTIVNNESSEIVRMLNAEFNQLAANPGLDLYPEDARQAIDEVGQQGSLNPRRLRGRPTARAKAGV